MSHFGVDVENILKQCRLCQTNIGTFELTENVEFIKQICECVKIQVDDTTSKKFLPKSVCNECKVKVESFFSYVQLVKRVDRSLRHILKRASKKNKLKKSKSDNCGDLLHSDNGSSCNGLRFSEINCKLEIDIFRNERPRCTICSNFLSDWTECERVNEEMICSNCRINEKKLFENPEISTAENCKNKAGCNIELKNEISIEHVNFEGTMIYNENTNNITANAEERNEGDLTRTKSKGFKGKVCKKAFLYHSDFNTHMKNHKTNFTCQREDCGKICTSAYSLRTHEMKHEGKRPFLCVTCGKGFITKNSLNCHEKIHSEVKGYCCNLCNIGFSVRSNLRAHEKKHHEGVRFYCSQCTRAFITKCSLERHERLHTGIKEYQCEMCPSAFYTNKELIKHKRYHQGIRQYKCDQCFKTFFEKHHLTVHLRAHTGERPYGCKIPGCGKSFTESQKLTRHLKARHPPLSQVI